MSFKVFTDGFEGFVKRHKERAERMTAGLPVPVSRGITFESAEEMAQLLTPARMRLFARLKKRRLSVQELACELGRNISAVRRDVSALEKFGLVESEHVVNPGHGLIRMVSAPERVIITAEL
jgi:predicted transcriptional regulator